MFTKLFSNYSDFFKPKNLVYEEPQEQPGGFPGNEEQARSLAETRLAMGLYPGRPDSELGKLSKTVGDKTGTPTPKPAPAPAEDTPENPVPTEDQSDYEKAVDAAYEAQEKAGEANPDPAPSDPNKGVEAETERKVAPEGKKSEGKTKLKPKKAPSHSAEAKDPNDIEVNKIATQPVEVSETAKDRVDGYVVDQFFDGNKDLYQKGLDAMSKALSRENYRLLYDFLKGEMLGPDGKPKEIKPEDSKEINARFSKFISPAMPVEIQNFKPEKGQSRLYASLLQAYMIHQYRTDVFQVAGKGGFNKLDGLMGPYTVSITEDYRSRMAGEDKDTRAGLGIAEVKGRKNTKDKYEKNIRAASVQLAGLADNEVRERGDADFAKKEEEERRTGEKGGEKKSFLSGIFGDNLDEAAAVMEKHQAEMAKSEPDSGIGRIVSDIMKGQKQETASGMSKMATDAVEEQKKKVTPTNPENPEENMSVDPKSKTISANPDAFNEKGEQIASYPGQADETANLSPKESVQVPSSVKPENQPKEKKGLFSGWFSPE